MSFDLFWEKMLTHAKRLNVNEPTLPRQRSQPRSMQDYFEYGKGKKAVHTCSKNLYRKHYFEVFDTVSLQLHQVSFWSGGFQNVRIVRAGPT